MKKLFKTLIICTLSINIFAQSASLEPNKVKFGSQYELSTSGGFLEFKGLSSNFGPTLAFINNQTNLIRGSVGSFNTANLTNTFGLNSNTSLTFSTLEGSFYPSKMTILNNGNVGISTEAPSTKFEVNGFSKLGSDAPAIKVKKLTGTSSPTQGGAVSIAHGLTASKILNVSVILDFGTNGFIPASYNYNSGYEFDWYSDATNIIVANKSGNSGSILSKPFKILITYEE